MDLASYPRVLFVTPCAFNHLTGSGVTFSNLFRGWPQDHLATLHRDSVPVSNDVCSRYFRLGWRELSPTLPFSAGVYNRGHLTPALEAWIKDFKPEVVYTLLGTVGYAELAQTIHERFQIPIVVHLMDEGVADPRIKSWLSPWIRKRYAELQRSILLQAAARLGISKKMSSVYAERFGVPFETFMNTVDMDRFPARTTLETGKLLLLVYTGAVLPFSQDQSLREVCTAVRSLHREGFAIRLDIYSSLAIYGESMQGMDHPECVFLHDAIQDDAVYFKTLKEADILVAPVNFDERTVHFIRYSMPTKVPSYLSTGTPILTYGPPNVAQIEYAEKDQWALVVPRQDPELLKKAVLTLAKDMGLRKKLSQTAISTARRNHDSSVVRKQFQTMLAKAAHG